MYLDFGSIIKEGARQIRVLGIRSANAEGGRLTLGVVVSESSETGSETSFLEIICAHAVDYSIRPMRPTIMEGGPAIEFHEEHPKLNASLQYIPGGDGEEFNPPRKFTMLELDQSYVIAERFLIEEK